MPESSASSRRDDLFPFSDEEVRRFAASLGIPWPIRHLPPMRVAAEGQLEPLLSPGDVLHCREQALYAAALSVECGSGQFPDDEAEKVVSIAKRFESYIVTGQ